MVGVFEFAEVADASDEVVKPHKRHTEHPCFGSHGLRVADIERRKRHHMVHVQWIDADAVFLELRLQWPFGGDVNRPMRS